MFPPLSSGASLFHCERKMADHPGAPPVGGGGGGVPIGPAPNPAEDTTASTAATTTMVIMPPSPAATRLFSDVRKGLEKSATGKLFVVNEELDAELALHGGVDLRTIQSTEPGMTFYTGAREFKKGDGNFSWLVFIRRARHAYLFAARAKERRGFLLDGKSGAAPELGIFVCTYFLREVVDLHRPIRPGACSVCASPMCVGTSRGFILFSRLLPTDCLHVPAARSDRKPIEFDYALPCPALPCRRAAAKGVARMNGISFMHAV